MATATKVFGEYSSINTAPHYSRQLRRFGASALLLLFTLMVLSVFLLPFGNMVIISLKNYTDLSSTANGPLSSTKSTVKSSIAG